jgi:hypothetical protein
MIKPGSVVDSAGVAMRRSKRPRSRQEETRVSPGPVETWVQSVDEQALLFQQREARRERDRIKSPFRPS